MGIPGQSNIRAINVMAHDEGRFLFSSPAWSSPVPELSFLPALYRDWTRAGERRVQDNLHAHAQNEPIKN